MTTTDTEAYVSIRMASELSGLKPDYIRKTAEYFCPLTDDRPPILNIVGDDGEMLVYLPDVMADAEACRDSKIWDVFSNPPTFESPF